MVFAPETNAFATQTGRNLIVASAHLFITALNVVLVLWVKMEKFVLVMELVMMGFLVQEFVLVRKDGLEVTANVQE
jgi:hypothetical protein